MGINWAGVSATVTSLVTRKHLDPRLVVPDISHLDWAAFRANGVTGVVIDKDNCITKPNEDELETSLRPAWDSLLKAFPPSNVLVVSNSAGTRKDSLLLQAESVSRNLQVPVLVHSTPKPGYSCARSIRTYFSPPPPVPESAVRKLWRKAVGRRREDEGAVIWPGRRHQHIDQPKLIAPSISTTAVLRPIPAKPCLLVIGDRLTTDTILAHRLASLPTTTNQPFPFQTVPVLTTTLHAREGFGTTFLRFIENRIVATKLRERALATSTPPLDPWDACVLDPSLLNPQNSTESKGVAPEAKEAWYRPSSIARRASEAWAVVLAAWTEPLTSRKRSPVSLLAKWHDTMGSGSREGGWADRAVGAAEGAVEHARLWGAKKSLGMPPKMMVK
ncbi:hypothetical protein T439DRAFT_326272 [Meredithblackwellia eburnea MCA 4105]